MAESVGHTRQFTVEEYLAFEESASVRHEYVGGELHAMSGATRRHNTIAGNIFASLWNVSRGGSCRIYMESVKLRVSEDTIYYPDVMVACAPEGDDPLIEDSPCLVVEVVSPSTESIDRREKLAAYRKLESLGAYLIVSQDERKLEHHFKGEDGVWMRRDIVEDSLEVSLPCPEDATLSLAEIYEGISDL